MHHATPVESDHSLVVRISQRDRTALSKLAGRHGMSLYAFAYGRLMDTDTADAIVTSIFEDLWSAPAFR